MSSVGDLISGMQPATVVATAMFVMVVGGLCLQFVLFSVKYPANLPLVSELPGKRHFTWRTRWKYMTDCENLYREAYEKFSKCGKTVLVPGLGFRNETILPQSAMKWLLAQPKTSLSPPQAIVELNQFGYSLGDDKYGADAWIGHVVRSNINAALERICGDMNQELQCAFETRLGTDENNWKELNLLDTVRLVVAQAASRFTVGLPLCRDEQYLIDCIKIGDSLVTSGGLTGGTPKPWRSLVGLLVSWFMKPQIERIKKHVRPTYFERLDILKSNPEDPGHSEPEDFFQMMMRFAQKERPDEVGDFDTICRRLIVANFGTMHNTAFQVANLVLNIISSDGEFNTISMLRNEFSAVLGKDGDVDGQGWTKAKVSSLTKADSVARETLRLDSFGNRFQFRKVLVDHVVTENGIRLPKGALVSMLGHPAHRDAEFLEDPDKYDPFRFSRAREAATDANGKPGLPKLTFVGTGPQHLPWGHGKHACPGRFLVDFELKMIMAYLLQNYDVEFPPEYEEKRPPTYWVAEAAFPPAGARIRIKRRPGTTK
ncbi:hypothetical protein PG993_003582 [Apiospora rasikravindrae]|uniref:Cytochrome P450 n=1 Tax=Apiospora rasikravindrae TaxID=990691 RepID=A0ABR1U005_9PEZI